MKIKRITARQILDSRGDWTVEVELELKSGVTVRASVPQGKSVGAREAASVPADKAVQNVVKTIAPAVTKREFADQRAFDEFLIELDGTPAKTRLGANAILAVSTAFARACAVENGVPLWKYLRKTFGAKNKPKRLPRLFINVINGGLHAGNNLLFQEYLAIPRTKNFSEAVDLGRQVYFGLRQYLENNFGERDLNVGDEGGFAPNFTDELEPFVILARVVRQLSLKEKIDFGADVAANNVNYEAKMLADIYHDLRQGFGAIYLEDPFREDDLSNFAELTKKFGNDVLVAGDDLTATNAGRMAEVRQAGAVNAMIVKPNQIGTVTEAWDAAMLAKSYGWEPVASHRSGETNDDFIADFAVAIEAFGLKLGAPARGERTAKYNRLLEIEKEI
ncbi:MAG: phosphopyruvate hydratase [Candidatus Niyogibacteria bacterium]|nr:phosphopyruvate hydratase [Candidatus Niyogibacteria bacterium]